MNEPILAGKRPFGTDGWDERSLMSIVCNDSDRCSGGRNIILLLGVDVSADGEIFRFCGVVGRADDREGGEITIACMAAMILAQSIHPSRPTFSTVVIAALGQSYCIQSDKRAKTVDLDCIADLR